MNFAESLRYLLSLGNEISAMKLGLKNITELLRELGSPQEKYLKVQVAGTNGKGSTCAFLEAICLEAGIRTGLNVSPHLISITERIRIDGKQISEDDFARHATRVRQAVEKLLETGRLKTVPTFFEHVTAIALQAFAESEVEIAILETGIGGRLDAVTAAKAEVLVFTPIHLDHQKILGDTIEKIAEEKAAIIRSGVSVVSSSQTPEALNVIVSRANKFQVPVRFTDEISVKVKEDKFFFKTTKAEYRDVKLGLLGRHQVENALTALLTAEELQKHKPISAKDIVSGLRKAKHEGRLEFDGKFLFDGAHNESGAKVLREFLDEFIKQPITMIFSTMKDKDLEKIAQYLFPKVNVLVLTQVSDHLSTSEKRSAPLENLLSEALKFLPSEKVITTKSVDEALAKAMEVSTQESIILVTGSLYLIGEVKSKRKSSCHTNSF